MTKIWAKTMTKTSELAVLDQAIAALGEQSYLGPWLASVRASVDADMRSDFVPMLLPSAAERQAEEILGDARRLAGEIETSARIRAGAVVNAAIDRSAAIIGKADKSLRLAQEALSAGQWS